MTATLQADLVEDSSATKCYLTAAAGETVTGTPDASGYVLTLGATQDWRYTLTTSGLTGIFRGVFHDGDANTVAQGYVRIKADSGTHIFVPDISTLKNEVLLDAILEDTGTTIPARFDSVDTAISNVNTTTGNIQTGVDTDLVALIQTVDDNVDAILDDTVNSLPNLLFKTNSLETSSSTESIYARVGETKSVTVTCSKDVSGLTLEVVFETSDKTDVGTIANGSITKSTLNASFSLTSSLTSVERTLRYTVKDTSTDETLASGRLFVTYDAQGD